MPKNERPTQYQREFLEGLGIVPSLTNAACQTLVDFVRKGNQTVGATSLERTLIVRDAQARCLGRRVCVNGQLGSIVYIRATSDLQRMHFRKDGEKAKRAPFEAEVKLDNGRRVNIELDPFQM